MEALESHAQFNTTYLPLLADINTSSNSMDTTDAASALARQSEEAHVGRDLLLEVNQQCFSLRLLTWSQQYLQ